VTAALVIIVVMAVVMGWSLARLGRRVQELEQRVRSHKLRVEWPEIRNPFTNEVEVHGTPPLPPLEDQVEQLEKQVSELHDWVSDVHERLDSHWGVEYQYDDEDDEDGLDEDALSDEEPET